MGVIHTSPIHHPESPKPSRSSSETLPELLASTLATPIVDSYEMKSSQLKLAVKTDRCSVPEDPALSGLTEAWRDSCESLVNDWDTIQDGVVCFAVLQETSTADRAAGALQQSDDAVTPLRELNIPGLTSGETPLKSPDDRDPERCLHSIVSGGGKFHRPTVRPRLGATAPSTELIRHTPKHSGVVRNTASFELLHQTAEVSEESATPALQIPDRKQTIASTKRQPTYLAVSKIETSARPHSPIPLTALTLFASLPAILLQADSFSKSSMRLDQLVLKPPDDGGPKRYPYEAVSFQFAVSAIAKRSPEPKTGSRPVSKPAFLQAYSCYPQSVERWWRARCKPPNIAVKAKRRLNSAVNKKLKLSDVRHLQSIEAVSILSTLSARILRILNPHRLSVELVRRVLKPPFQVAYKQSLNKTVNMTNKRKGLVTNLSWFSTRSTVMLPSSPIPLVSIAPPPCCGSQMPGIASLTSMPSSSFTQSCLWTA
ncbi:hypothetical protein F5887DRAFT_1239877 [Amanita rubescens]|nr:hypothetical protein F5887DRAFT_1239877 [Amanita rubescens]